jgi:hypothetical protein
MSKNTLLSNLINYISANSSGNVVIAAPSSGLALDVTGTGRFTGALTLGSTITNGTFTYTLPSATGTLALTSALSAYLPLSGGTLTGALGGTSATFSGTFGSILNITGNSAGNNSTYYTATNNTSNTMQLGIASSTYVNSSYPAIVSNGAYLYSPQTLGLIAESGYPIYLQTGGLNRLTIASTGAATFSSSVTAGGAKAQFIADGGSSYGAEIILKTSLTTNPTLRRNWSIATEESIEGDFQIKSSNVAGGSPITSRLSILSNGNVGINTTAPSEKLHVAGNALIGTGNNGLLYVVSSGQTLPGQIWATNGDNAGLLLGAGASSGYVSSIQLNGNWNGSGASGGDIIMKTASSERMRIDSSGNLIFTGQSSSKIQFYRAYSGDPANVGLALFNTSGTTVIALNANGGGIFTASLGTGIVYSSGGSLTSTNPSDKRLKKNIKSISYGLSDIMKLRPVSYDWETDNINQGIQFGFIAQEVQEIMPEAIKEFGEDVKYLGLEKDAIYATLVKAIQEQQAQILELKQLINK